MSETGSPKSAWNTVTSHRLQRAQAIAAAGGLDQAIASCAVPQVVDVTLSEAIVLGLVRQGVRTLLCVLGHGSTDVGEVLRIYQQAGLVQACALRNEIEAGHAAAVLAAERVVVKVGGGARNAGSPLAEFLELADGLAVTSPLVSGVIPFDHPRNMTVGRSKGSICGHGAMEQADQLVAVGTRFVCQSDCSRTGYPKVRQVVNINTDPEDATHYGRTIALVGDASVRHPFPSDHRGD